MLLAVASGTVTRLQGVLMALAYLGFVAARYEDTDHDGVGPRLSAGVALVFYRREEVGRRAGVGCLLLYVPTLFLG